MSGFDDNGTVDLQDLRIRLYDHLGHRYSAVSPSPGALILLQDANMLSSPNGQYDCFGRVRGVGFDGTRFSVQEVRAQGDGESQGFDGLIVSVSHSLSIYGRTIVMPKRGVASPRHIDGMKEVDLPSGTIDERFEVYADNQVEGRSLIRPGFLRQLAEFGPMLADGHASVAFTGRQMHVVLPTGELSRFSHDTEFSSHDAAADHIASEIAKIFDIVARVDALHSSADRRNSTGREKTRIDYYLTKTQSAAPMIKAAMAAGIVTDNRRAKYLRRESAIIDSAVPASMLTTA